ncbi:MAG: hypothetical protein H0W72_16610, partial [Planctomycetes bacterium]|nr:hypothetical protein [Planctomycetota bacterium]
LDLADLRARLARAALDLLPGPRTEAENEAMAACGAAVGERPATTNQPVPGPAAQQALLRFVSSNLTRAENDRLAARQARARAREALIALDEERERARIEPSYTARLPLPGAAGRAVRLRYVVERADWAPMYRIEVNAGAVVLVREALIDVPRDQGWRQGRLELVTRPPADDLLLRDLQVPVLELGDEVLAAGGGSKKRALGKFGGSKASESAVDVNLRATKAAQAADGSWGPDAWRIHATALTTLTLLGAGYDHKMPSKYKSQVRRAIDWLSGHCLAADLGGQALVTTALAEAYAMSNDPALKEPAERAAAALLERVAVRHELDVGIYRRGAMAGPELLAWTALAVKVLSSAGLTVDSRLADEITRLLPELDGHADRDEARVSRLFVEMMTGRGARSAQPPVSEWIERGSHWLQEGRPELVYFATMGLFQRGGDAWALWNATMRDRLIDLQTIAERSGWQAVTPYPLGEQAARAMTTLPLEVYYRYTPIDKSGGGDALANRRGSLAVPELPALADVAQAARNWPLRIDAGKARLMDGQRVRVQLDRTALPGRITLVAAPAAGPGAWRVLNTSNPLSVPLLAGDAEVVVDGERLGVAPLPFTEPGKPLQLALGRDDRVQVARSEEHTDDEAWGKRTRTYTVSFRVDAPAGLYDAIRIDEAMPAPQDGSIQLVSVEPPIPGAELDRRLVEDPVWHLDVGMRKPPASATITWQLRYPASVRPQVGALSPAQVNLEEIPPSEEDDAPIDAAVSGSAP